VRWPPAWELVSWSKSSIVGHSPDNNDVNTEAESIVKIRYWETTSGSRLRKFSMCCSDL
jgi:hypothetical protein